jgi:Rv0078B-related antitoxin
LPRPCKEQVSRELSRCQPSAKQLQLVSTMDPELKKILQAMTPAQKLRAAERLYWSARQLKAAALRAEHPDWTEEAIQHAVREIFLYARS